ncbi:glycerol-3-phosphate acyltransferase, partial [Vibrio parahaemolyticus]|nr:glycerol-3-phosphate acyltransferase [Vibrio parahaemolyticus]
IRRLLSGDEPKIGEKKLTQKNSA